jgi:hypothetical protein
LKKRRWEKKGGKRSDMGAKEAFKGRGLERERG